MDNTGVVGPIKGCVGSGRFFGFHHESTLCHHTVTGRIMSKKSSKDDILFIESHQIFRVSIYSEGITAAYFDHNNEC